VLDIRLKTAIENELAKEELRSPRGVLRAGVRVDFSDPELERTISLNGFGMIEPTGRWTIAQKAGFVATLAGDMPRDAFLELEVSAMVGPSHGQTLEVRCAGGPTHEFSFLPGGTGPITIAVPVNSPTKGAAWRVQFLVPCAISTIAVGSGEDRRQLGVKVHSLRVASPVPTLTASRAIDLANPDSSDAIILSGFGPREGKGRWTIGLRSSFALAIPPPGAENVLELELTALAGPSHGQKLEIRGDGALLHRFWFPPGKTKWTKILVPLPRPLRGTIMTLHLSLPDAVSPKALGQGDDSRVLGVQIHAIRLVRRSVGSTIRTSLLGFLRRSWDRPRQ
jgi:hypothetical protein